MAIARVVANVRGRYRTGIAGTRIDLMSADVPRGATRAKANGSDRGRQPQRVRRFRSVSLPMQIRFLTENQTSLVTALRCGHFVPRSTCICSVV